MLSILWRIYQAVMNLATSLLEIRRALQDIQQSQRELATQVQSILDILDSGPATSIGLSAGPVEEQPVVRPSEQPTV